MPVAEVPLPSWVDALQGTAGDGPWTDPERRDLLVVDLDEYDGVTLPPLTARWPVVVAGTTSRADPTDHPAASVCDLAVAAGDDVLDRVATTLVEHPIAATAFALLLRSADTRSVEAGLVAESATYSALQAGPEFATWRASRPVRSRTEDGPPVELRRDGDVLHVVLRRSHVRNAVDSAMRDALVDGFDLVRADPSIAQVHFEGEGPAFCSGGDLDEFGRFEDPARAHLLRLRRSAGRAIHAVAERVTAHLHGPCLGAGIELPAFAEEVLAASDTRIALPEVTLGLVPGAGGTVSLPRRIGRHRTALLGLSGDSVDAETAQAWGLVDRLV